MDTRREIIWYGRDGQGVFSAAKLFGAAYALKGGEHYALALPSFGPERHETLMCAYTKLDTTPVYDRTAVRLPDHVVCFDEEFVGDLGQVMVKEGGSLVFASEQVKDLSQQVLGTEFVNTALLALLAVELGDLDVCDLERAIAEVLPEHVQAENVELVHAVYAAASELSADAVRIVRQPEPRKQRPHERNFIEGGAEYMDIMTSDAFGKPHQQYRPGGTQNEER